MEKKRATSLRRGALFRFILSISVIIAVFAGTVGWLAGNIRQGLDLQGGTHIVMQAEDTEQNKVTPEAINQVINIMQKRVNEMGLTEPIIQREGARRIIIELPGEKDPKKAIETIGKTAVLEDTKMRIKTSSIKSYDLTKIAASVEALYRIRTLNTNEVRRLLKYEEIKEVWADEYMETKNYQEVNKGFLFQLIFL